MVSRTVRMWYSQDTCFKYTIALPGLTVIEKQVWTSSDMSIGAESHRSQAKYSQAHCWSCGQLRVHRKKLSEILVRRSNKRSTDSAQINLQLSLYSSTGIRNTRKGHCIHKLGTEEACTQAFLQVHAVTDCCINHVLFHAIVHLCATLIKMPLNLTVTEITTVQSP